MSQLAVVVVRASVNANPHCPARDRHTFVSTGPQAKPFQRRDDTHACTRFLVTTDQSVRHQGAILAAHSGRSQQPKYRGTAVVLSALRTRNSYAVQFFEGSAGVHGSLTGGSNRGLPRAAESNSIRGNARRLLRALSIEFDFCTVAPGGTQYAHAHPCLFSTRGSGPLQHRQICSRVKHDERPAQDEVVQNMRMSGVHCGANRRHRRVFLLGPGMRR